MTKPTGRPKGRPPKARADAEAMARTDGVVNAALNIGGQGDAVSQSKYAPVGVLTRPLLERMYRSDGIAKRVVDLPVDDAMREWVETDAALLKEFSRIKAKGEIVEALKQARLFGGAVVVALIDDGLDFDQPVNMNGIRRVMQLRAYHRHRTSWTAADVDMDPNSATFGEPMFYNVQPNEGPPYRVHVSRLHKLDGLALPDEARQRNNGWGDSALQPAYEALRNYGVTMGASANIVRDFIQSVIGISGLSDMVRQGNDDLITKRANLIDMTRSVANTMFIDTDGETYDKRASSVTGLPDLWDRFAMHVASATGIPATRLLGKAPQGMNATGEGDERNWYDVVKAYQQDQVEPCIDWLVELLDAQLDWRAADRPATMDWTFPPLGQPSEADWAAIKKTTADADAIYMDRGAVDPAFLFAQRYGHGEFRPEADLSDEAFQEWEGAPEEGEAVEAAGGAIADAQKEALNGAQITALQAIVQSVADGTLPAATAVQIISVAFNQVSEEQAKRIIDPADGFTPEDLGKKEQSFNPADNSKAANQRGDVDGD